MLSALGIRCTHALETPQTTSIYCKYTEGLAFASMKSFLNTFLRGSKAEGLFEANDNVRISHPYICAHVNSLDLLQQHALRLVMKARSHIYSSLSETNADLLRQDWVCVDNSGGEDLELRSCTIHSSHSASDQRLICHHGRCSP